MHFHLKLFILNRSKGITLQKISGLLIPQSTGRTA